MHQVIPPCSALPNPASSTGSTLGSCWERHPPAQGSGAAVAPGGAGGTGIAQPGKGELRASLCSLQSPEQSGLRSRHSPAQKDATRGNTHSLHTKF